jgi:hypothetical protein
MFPNVPWQSPTQAAAGAAIPASKPRGGETSAKRRREQKTRQQAHQQASQEASPLICGNHINNNNNNNNKAVVVYSICFTHIRALDRNSLSKRHLWSLYGNDPMSSYHCSGHRVPVGLLVAYNDSFDRQKHDPTISNAS